MITFLFKMMLLGMKTLLFLVSCEVDPPPAPVPVTWASVSAGNRHTLAIRPDGTLWAWGNNSSGQLGDGTTTTRLSPVQIGTATNWASVAIGSGGHHTLAIRTDGTLWAWGENMTNQLGDGTTTDRFSPVGIGAATNWESVVAGTAGIGIGHTVAIRTDGTLWAWGANSSGQLGDGTVSKTKFPAQ